MQRASVVRHFLGSVARLRRCLLLGRWVPELAVTQTLSLAHSSQEPRSTAYVASVLS